jgi:quercetin dioxygenase-like cupin family protein
MRTTIATALLLALAGAAASAQAPNSHGAQEFKWGPAPAVFPKGAQIAVLQGDPSSAAQFTVRFRFPDGYRIAPHTHPTDENVTVISGVFKVGMGKKFETNGMLALPAGGFVTAPANEAHYAVAQGPVVVQVHAMGPFALTYVNRADAPKTGVAKK